MLWLTSGVNAQLSYKLGTAKTVGMHYSSPAGNLGVQYQYKIFQANAGMITNWSEYYTTFHLAAGVATTGNFYASASIGAGMISDVPTNKNYNVMQFGFYASAAIGYKIRIADGYVCPFVGVEQCGRMRNLEAGIVIGSGLGR